MTENNERFIRNSEYIFRKIVDEMVLVPIHKDVADLDSIYTLNEVGAFIWEILAQPVTQNDLNQAVMEEFEADAATVSADVEAFISELSEFGAVLRSE